MKKLLILLSLACHIVVSGQFGINIGNFEGAGYTNEFVTKWNIPSGSFTFPAGNIGTYNATIDWGDSTTSEITTYNDADLTHTYTSSGERIIQVTGTFPWFYLNNSATGDLLIKVINWGNIHLESLVGAFYGAGNLNELPEGPITGASSVASLNNTFRNTGSLLLVDDNLLDSLVNVTSMVLTFNNSEIKGVPPGFLDKLVLLTNMQQTFFSSGIDSIPHNLLDYNILLTSLYGTFASTGITYIPDNFIDNNDKITVLAAMFSGCSNLSGSSGEFWLNPSGASNYTLIPPDYDSGVPNGQNCYQSCTGLSDYSTIPIYWK